MYTLSFFHKIFGVEAITFRDERGGGLTPLGIESDEGWLRKIAR